MKHIIMSVIASSALNASAGQVPTELNSELAKSYVDKALDCGRKNNWKLSVAVVNAEGNLLSFRRDDGAYVGSIDASQEKAKSSNAFQRPTSSFVASVMKDQRVGLLSVKGIVAVEGGVPIVLNGKQVGAIGVSGARSVEDEQCANAAIHSN